MESTFIIQQSELNEDFLESLKRLFKYSRQLQITVSTSEDFGLLKKETPSEYIARLEKNLKEIKEPQNVVTLTESQLNEFILDKL